MTEEKMKKNVENPYSPSRVAAPRHFANRAHILKRFRAAVDSGLSVKTPNPINIAVSGEWGIGKSSILIKFEDILGSEYVDSGVFSMRVALTNEDCRDMNSLSRRIVEKIREGCESAGIAPLVETKKAGSARDLADLVVEAQRMDLDGSLTRFWFDLFAPNGKRLVIIMIDDAHLIADNNPSVLEDLKIKIQEVVSKGCNYMFVIAGAEELFYFERERAEPFLRLFDKHELKRFTADETVELIQKPIEVDNLDLKVADDVIREIHRSTQGHPYFINYFMRYVFS